VLAQHPVGSFVHSDHLDRRQLLGGEVEIQLPLQKLMQLVCELLHHGSVPQSKLFQEQQLDPFDVTGDCVGESVPVGGETGFFVGLAVGARFS
jgi:hypothetical protein